MEPREASNVNCGAQLVRERRNNVLGDGMRAIRRDGDDSGGERNEDATRQEAI